MNAGGGGSRSEEILREVRVDAAPEGCPICRFSQEEGQRAILRPADPCEPESGTPFTVNLVGDREATRGALAGLQDHPRMTDLEVVNLTPYAMVLKARERDPEEASAPTLLAAVQSQFGDDVIVDPFVVDEGVSQLRALLVEPQTARETLQTLQKMQSRWEWEDFQVHGVSAFDPKEHAGLLRRVLAPGEESLLRLAVDMGYYETPKKCTLEDIADEVGLSPSPVHKRLKRSEERLVHAFLEPESVTNPDTAGETPQWVQEIARSDGPMVEILARYRWEDSKLYDYMEAHPDARLVLHPFYDDPHHEGVSFLALASGGEAGSFAKGAKEIPYLRNVEVLREDAEHSVIRVEAVESPSFGGTTPLLDVSRRLGREAYLNPVYAEGGDVWVSVVTARHLTFEDVEAELEAVGEEAGWTDWDLVSIRPLEGTGAGSNVESRELTDRQREVLDIARALGYYKTPRESTLEDIARTLGVSENAVHKNLTAAERKIVRTYLQGNI